MHMTLSNLHQTASTIFLSSLVAKSQENPGLFMHAPTACSAFIGVACKAIVLPLLKPLSYPHRTPNGE